jgi:cytochrome c-type biogenesis protein CcsB
LPHLFLYITAIVYLAASFVFMGYLITHREGLSTAGKFTLLGGLGSHTITIISRSIEAATIPLATLHESLTLFSWLTVAVCAAFVFRYRIPVLGAFVAPLALLLITTASILPAEVVEISPVLRSWWLPVHVTLAFLGNAFFALACIFGIMYLIQERHLKTHRIGGLYYVLPSVEALDELNYRCLTYGFPLLTLGMITGALWSEYAFGTYWMWKHRQVWSLITWLLYAVLLHGRVTAGWRGRKSAKYSVVAFAVLVAGSTIIYILLGSAHGLLR